MTGVQNQALKALPNVLRDQTIPNTLGGIGLPRPASRSRLPVGALAAAAVVILAGLAILLGRLS